MVKRTTLVQLIRIALRRSRVAALIGPRQCGKTTLARQFLAADSPDYFDLEDPISMARLAESMTALGELKGLIVIDEIQRRPVQRNPEGDARAVLRYSKTPYFYPIHADWSGFPLGIA